VGLLGACFGATSSWFQSALGWSTSNSDAAASLVATITRLVAGNGALIVGLVAAVLLVPTAFYVAMGRE